MNNYKFDSRGTGYTLYRINCDNTVTAVNREDTVACAVQRLENDYLPNSQHGERYFIVALSTGVVMNQYLVTNQPKLVVVRP